MSNIDTFQDWLEAVREAGNCPLNIDELLDEWPNFPDDYLHGTIKPDNTVPCADIRRAAQYADFNPEYTESSVQEVTDEDYRQAYYGDSSYGSGTLQTSSNNISHGMDVTEIEVTIDANDIKGYYPTEEESGEKIAESHNDEEDD